MQFKILGQKIDAMSAGREKIDDGEKEFGGWAGNVFLMEKWRGNYLPWCFGNRRDAMQQLLYGAYVACSHAAITLGCLNFATFKARSWFQCSVAAHLINENGGSSSLRSPGPVPMHIDSLCDWP